jgi:aspartate/methionine/tyrosine aminotransferase
VTTAARRYLGIEPKVPAGAFYWWLPLPPKITDPIAFCLRVRDEGKVVLVPGQAFGPAGEGFVRLSFAAQPADIEEGIRRLAPFWKKPDA